MNEKLDNLIKRHRQLKLDILTGNSDEKTLSCTRNEIFEIVLLDISNGISQVLKKFKFSMDKKEQLSLSWDCFLYCMGHLKNNSPLGAHFFVYSKYFTLDYMKNIKKEKRNMPCIPFNERKHSTETLLYNPESIIEQLYKIFNDLKYPDNIIFDDALTSLTMNKKSAGISNLDISGHIYRKKKEKYKKMIQKSIKELL